MRADLEMVQKLDAKGILLLPDVEQQKGILLFPDVKEQKGIFQWSLLLLGTLR